MITTTIWGVIHAHNKDKRDGDLDRKKWEQFIIQQVKQNSEDAMKNMKDKYDSLKQDFEDLQA
ncbi:hypothetical protein, partial [Lactobacillus selangorensis]